MSTASRDWTQDERQALSGLHGQLEIIRQRHEHDPPMDLLRAARADVLPPDEQARVGAHLEASAWSRTLVDGLAEGWADSEAAGGLDSVSNQRLLGRIRRQLQAASGGSRSRWWNPAALGGLAVAASLLIAVMVTRERPTPAAVAEPQSPTIAAPMAAVQAPRGPLLQIAFAKPEVRLGAGALTWRGAPSENPFLLDLKPAFDAYREGDYARADARFGRLSATYPESIEVLFYQGVTRMLRDDFAGAVAPLTSAARLGNRAFADDVSWYLAVAEQRSGRVAASESRLSTLCTGGSSRATDACAAAAQIAALTAPPPSTGR